MKRFHVHLHVDDLQRSIGFYSRLFAAEPTRIERDYAKWMLEDPRLNFAISTRGSRPGIDHVGFQTDDPAELAALKARAEAADMALLDEGQTTCCYARSEKHWVTDPQGLAWEHFHTLGDIPVFHEPAHAAPATSAATAATAGAMAADAGAASAVAVDAGAASAEALDAGAASACCAPKSPAAAAPEPAAAASACCSPAPRGKPIGIAVKSAGSCC